MTAALKIGVVGTGYLGDHHVRLMANVAGVELAGFVELDGTRAAEVEAKYGVRRFASIEERDRWVSMTGTSRPP